ncbi:MAG: hypothetical protein HZB62_03305 [Nitrospirae bacterium]|nr:hypothetical protein [Nitrospirota bacterium]
MKKIAIMLLVIIQFISASAALAQTPAITQGLNYLFSVQNPDGSWGNEISQRDVLPATVAVIETLQRFSYPYTAQYQYADTWLRSQGLETSDHLSERVQALSMAGTDSNLLLSYIDELSYA